MSTEIVTPLRVHIRWTIRRDFPAIMAIERASFARPLSEDAFLQMLRRRNCIGMTAEAGERVLGFMVYELGKRHLEVLDLAVHPDHRRRGVGRQLLTKLVGKMSPIRRTRIAFPVLETHLGAQYWLRSCGFRAVGVGRDYFESGDDHAEDAYHFRFDLAPLPDDEAECGEPAGRAGEGPR